MNAYVKRSSYSPPETISPSPAKPWTNKLKVYSYTNDGTASAFKEAPSNTSTKRIVDLRDTGETNT